jgi:hypothetical protein
MAKGNGRFVHPRPDGSWANLRPGASRPASVHDTQQAAIQAARQMLTNAGGGELSVAGRNGQIRTKDTIAPGNDPCPPRDKGH